MPRPHRACPRQLHNHQAYGSQPDPEGARQGLAARPAQGRRLGRRFPRKPHYRMNFFTRFPWPSRRYGEEMRAAIARITDKHIVKVFVSNQHPDYFLGSQAFADVPIAALPGTIEGIRAEGRAVPENMSRLIGDWMRGTEAVVPAEPVFAATQIYGGHRLRLIPLSGHTQADLAIYDEATRVLFAGGLVFSDRTPTTPHADIPEWLVSLDELAALDVAVLIPNHGTI